jgi:hypothetical protein
MDIIRGALESPRKYTPFLNRDTPLMFYACDTMGRKERKRLTVYEFTGYPTSIGVGHYYDIFTSIACLF